MKRKTVLITGSSGLVGSESVRFFADKGFYIIGIDNDMRKYFFGPEASTKWQGKLLQKKYKNSFKQFSIDIRNAKKIEEIFKEYQFDLIIHTAAQPSHDWSAKEPITDFTINANGTLVLLENFRKYASDATFIFMSSIKVYGDTSNNLPLIELPTRFEIDKKHPFYKNGIDESMSIDQSRHSLFGVSKLSGDLMVQEYGRYFGLNTVLFRGGCLTGSGHSGTMLHGFLAYLVKCIATSREYPIFGHKGKQVRDNMHASDLAHAFYHVYQNPRKGEVYNIGGSRHANISIIEAVQKIEKILNKKAKVKYIKEPRVGDHKWNINDISKFRKHYPKWNLQYTMDQILLDLCNNGHF